MSQDKFWQYPSKQDKQEVFLEQILDVDMEGEWTMEERNRQFTVVNEKEINYALKELNIEEVEYFLKIKLNQGIVQIITLL